MGLNVLESYGTALLKALGEMADDYRECTKSLITCLWAVSLVGAEQLTRVLSPREPGPAGRHATGAFAAVTHTTAMQLGDTIGEVFRAGDRLQRGMVDLMHSLVTLEALAPRHMTKMTFGAMQQSAEVLTFLMPGRESRLAWQELNNKLQAFDLFEHVDVTLRLPLEIEVPLTVLVERAHALGPYLGVWAMEGLGRYYSETYWAYHGTPQNLLTADQVGALPASSLIPLHTGMGLSLADRLLATLAPRSSDADIDSALRQFIALCQQNSREGYAGAAVEALGLVTRLRYPQLVRRVDWRLSAIAPDISDYFWHGVGRGLYFLPNSALPWSRSSGRAITTAQREAPHTAARLNTLAGLAWAVTLVNVRHPAILEAFLTHDSDVLAVSDAFSTGVSAAVMIWYDMDQDDSYLRAFWQYQPDPSHPRLVQLWNSQVREPSQDAVQRYYGVLKAWHGLGEIFRYQPLSALVDRLQEEAVA